MAQQPLQPRWALGVALELIIFLAGYRVGPARCEGLLFGGLISFAGLRAPFRAAPCARAVCVWRFRSISADEHLRYLFFCLSYLAITPTAARKQARERGRGTA